MRAIEEALTQAKFVEKSWEKGLQEEGHEFSFVPFAISEPSSHLGKEREVSSGLASLDSELPPAADRI